jgi:hypothetical protein
MKIYSDTLTAGEVRMAATDVNGSRLGGQIGFETFEPMQSPRKRRRGWNVRLYRIGSQRHFNTGTHGAGDQGAADWDDYGAFLAALYEKDSRAVAGYYTGRENFHRSTDGKYRPVR